MAHIDDVIEVMNRASKAESEVKTLRVTQSVLVEALKAVLEGTDEYWQTLPEGIEALAKAKAALARAEASK